MINNSILYKLELLCMQCTSTCSALKMLTPARTVSKVQLMQSTSCSADVDCSAVKQLGGQEEEEDHTLL